MAGPPDTDQRVGRVLGGRYRLVSVIGAGAAGTVYLAEDPQLHRRVAVKMLHPGLADDGPFLERFRTEARSAAALSFENLLRVYDWGDGDPEQATDGPYVVEEFLAGGSLRAMVDEGRRLTPSQALVVGLEASRGLAHAHKRGFVHRDLKPSNLLFDAHGRLRVADFGLARALAAASWTRGDTHSAGGTRYASPEQLSGRRPGPRGDVYSLALVLIEAVTGVVPGFGTTAAATLAARTTGDLAVPEALGPLRSVLAHCTRLDPDERPEADELEIALLASAELLPRPEPLPLVPPLPDELANLPAGEPVTSASVPDSAFAGPATDVMERPEAVERRPSEAAVVEADDEPVAETRVRVLIGVVAMAVLIAAGVAGWWFFVRVPTFEVPEVTGLDRVEAVRRLDGHEWIVDDSEMTREDDTRPEQVIGQEPRAGEQLPRGGTVRLRVSLGPTLVSLPAVAGVPVAEATQTLEAAGLVVERTEANDEQVAAGSVVKLDGGPGGETSLPKGSKVTLTVSTGPRPRTVPKLVGLTQAAATDALQKEGLVFAPAEDFSETVPQGSVMATNPKEGVTVDRGDQVAVVLSKGPKPVPVPNVAGLSGIDATARLQADGFTVSGIEGPPTGVVLATDPPGGEQRPKGTGIRIFTRQ